MYQRFLTDKDYLNVATENQLNQLIRDVHDRIPDAERSAEMSMREYLSQYYEVEKELDKGKNIREYSPMINYPPNVYFKKDEVIYRTLRAIRGYKKPDYHTYWERVINTNAIKDLDNIKKYLQVATYSPGDFVLYGTDYWVCKIENGMDFKNIQIPGFKAWNVVDAPEWQAIADYSEHTVVSYQDKFYTLLYKGENYDNSINPVDSDSWGQIGEYSNEYQYKVDEDSYDYVVLDNIVYKPIVDPNAEELREDENANIIKDDPRNYNMVKHMKTIAIYYLHQTISPTNVSETRRLMYEDSMDWLYKASKLKIDPQIPRKIDNEGKPKVDWATATFQTEFNVNANPWII